MRARESERTSEQGRDRCIILPCAVLCCSCCCCIPVVRSPLLCYTRAPALSRWLDCALSVHARTSSYSLARSLARSLAAAAAAALQLHSCLSGGAVVVSLCFILCFCCFCCCCFNFCCCCCFCCVVLCVHSSWLWLENYATFTNRTLQKVEVNLPRSSERSLPCGICC